MGIINVVAENGKTYPVKYKDYGEIKSLDDEGLETVVYWTDFECEDRIITSRVPVWLAKLSGQPNEFRRSEDAAFLEGLIYAVNGSLIASINGQIEYLG